MDFAWFAWCFLSLICHSFLWGIISLATLLLTGTNLEQIVSAVQTTGNTFCTFVLLSPVFYLAFMTLSMFLRKIKWPDISFFRFFCSSFIRGITNPFRQTYLFLLIVTRRHIIQDDSPLHNFEDFLQVLFPFLWYFVLAVFIACGFLGLR